jgi:hypothetical protein
MHGLEVERTMKIAYILEAETIHVIVLGEAKANSRHMTK